MDFEKTLKLLIKEFEKEKISYALIGGFALGALGIIRATIDIDFLIDFEDSEKIKIFMEKNNYRCIHKTKNVSQFTSNDQSKGSVDFIHAFREKSISMLERTREIKIFNNKHTIKVLIPEDLIGMKLQGAVNDKKRENRDFADIELLMEKYQKELDWNLIKDYFELFKMHEKYKILKKTYK